VPITKCQIPASPPNCLLSKILCRSHPEALPEYSADYEANQVRKRTMDEQPHGRSQPSIWPWPRYALCSFNLRFALCPAFTYLTCAMCAFKLQYAVLSTIRYARYPFIRIAVSRCLPPVSLSEAPPNSSSHRRCLQPVSLSEAPPNSSSHQK
jgi:hypothetical protein